jgi:hypothetical protein
MVSLFSNVRNIVRLLDKQIVRQIYEQTDIHMRTQMDRTRQANRNRQVDRQSHIYVVVKGVFFL